MLLNFACLPTKIRYVFVVFLICMLTTVLLANRFIFYVKTENSMIKYIKDQVSRNCKIKRDLHSKLKFDQDFIYHKYP